MEPNNKKPDQDTLRLQLSELNSRSRWYSSQLWHVPFAYLGLTGIIVANLASSCPSQQSLGLIVSALFGVLVSFHICAMKDGERRAVENLKEMEQKLDLPPTVEYKKWYHLPLQIAVLGATILYAVVGIYLAF